MGPLANREDPDIVCSFMENSSGLKRVNMSVKKSQTRDSLKPNVDFVCFI